MARIVLIAIALLATTLAGCVDAPTPVPSESIDAAATAPDEAPAAAPFSASGRAWLPPSSSGEREETLVVFPVNASGMVGEVTLRLGMQYVVELPPAFSDVQVEVRAPSGDVVATATLTMGAPDATFALESLVVGEHALALLSYGGSGGGTGDFVDWRIDVRAPGA